MTVLINASKKSFCYEPAVAELKSQEDLILLAGQQRPFGEGPPPALALTNERLFEVKWDGGVFKQKWSVGRQIPLSKVKKATIGTESSYDGASDLLLGVGSSGHRSHPFVCVATEKVNYKYYFKRNDCEKILDMISTALPSKLKSFKKDLDSIAEEIRKLKELLDEGILSQEEFQQAKNKLLRD